jgi:hypothetical protein
MLSTIAESGNEEENAMNRRRNAIKEAIVLKIRRKPLHWELCPA